MTASEESKTPDAENRGDELDWNIERDGRMRDYATQDEPATIPWEG